MKKIKTIVDREPLGSDYIASRQNFDQVVHQASQLSVPTWKSAWFYGPIGMAVIAVTVSVVTIDPASAETHVAHSIPDAAELQSPETDKVVIAQHANEDDKSNTQTPESESETVPAAQVNTPVRRAETPAVVPTPEPVAQVETPSVEAAPSTNSSNSRGNYVHIGPHYLGEIPVDALNQPLECNDEIRIIAFNVHFNTLNGTETAPIIGNKIPAKIIEAIKQHNIGYMITFTDIKGKNAEGKVVSLLPMNFIATNLK
jgi:hypothetical protein